MMFEVKKYVKAKNGKYIIEELESINIDSIEIENQTLWLN